MPQEQERFHFEKTINAGHLLTTMVMVVSIFMYFGDFDKRIAANEQSIEYMKSQRSEDLDRVESKFEQIDSKLDYLIAETAKK